MIRPVFLAAAFATLAASETDATQNELRQASEARARDAAYQQQAYAPNLGSGGIDVHAAGQRIAEGIRAREQADAAEKSASDERSRRAFAAIAAQRAAEEAEEARAATEESRRRAAREQQLQVKWLRRMATDVAALEAVPAATRDDLHWRRLCAALLHQWDQTTSPDRPDDSRWQLPLRALLDAAGSGNDAARVVLALIDAKDGQLTPERLAELDQATRPGRGGAPRCALLLAHARAGLRLPGEVYVWTLEEALNDGSLLYVRLGMDLLRRIESAPLPAAERERTISLLDTVAASGDPGLAMPARTALAILAPGRPLPSLVPLWSSPGGGSGGGSGEPLREWALMEHLISGLVATAGGDQTVLDGLAAALEGRPAILAGQARFRSLWVLLRREASGWTMGEATSLPQAYPWSPWYHLHDRNAAAPSCWSSVRGADLLWRTRAYDTLPQSIPWLPGELDTALHPIDWSMIQDMVGVRAAAVAGLSDATPAVRRAGALIAGVMLYRAAGSVLADFTALGALAAGDMRRLLLARARSSALLGTALDHGLARVPPAESPGLLKAAANHLDAAAMAIKALALDRQPDEQPVETAWIPRLAVRLAHPDAVGGWQSIPLAVACLKSRLPMAPEDQAVLERLAAGSRPQAKP